MVKLGEFDKLEEKLYSAVISDILDEIENNKIKNYALDNLLRPLKTDMVVMGRAFTILSTEVYQKPEKPYKLELEAIDNTKKGEVVVAKTEKTSGFWGGLLTAGALSNGCRGAIIDGYTRDSKDIREMNFPTFIKGFSPYDSKGRAEVVDYQVPIKSGDVIIEPGELVFADNDGIVKIPREIEDMVIEKAYKKIEKEKNFKEELFSGASLQELFDKYQIL